MKIGDLVRWLDTDDAFVEIGVIVKVSATATGTTYYGVWGFDNKMYTASDEDVEALSQQN